MFNKIANSFFCVGTTQGHFKKLTWIIRRLETLSGVAACTATDNKKGIKANRNEDIIVMVLCVCCVQIFLLLFSRFILIRPPEEVKKKCDVSRWLMRLVTAFSVYRSNPSWEERAKWKINNVLSCFVLLPYYYLYVNKPYVQFLPTLREQHTRSAP